MSVTVKGCLSMQPYDILLIRPGCSPGQLEIHVTKKHFTSLTRLIS